MNFTQDHFDNNTFRALEEIKMLTFISQELRKMAPTFENSLEIDKNHANAPAIVVLKSIEDIANSLQRAILKKFERREKQLSVARKKGADKLSIAIEQACILAKMEQGAFKGIDASRSMIKVQVIDRLTQIVTTWRSLSA